MSITSAIVTGANRGLGYQFVKQLLAHPSAPIVIATCRKPNDATELNSLKSNNRLQVHQLNISDFSSYQPFIDNVTNQLKDTGLNLLINNAGVMENVDLRTGTGSQMVSHYTVNSVAPFILARSLLPLLQSSAKVKKSNNSQLSPLVFNISATLGCLSTDTPAPGGGHISYRMSKAALNMVTKQLAPDLKKRGINIISVHPGWVSTDMGGPKAPMTPEASVAHMIKLIESFDDGKNGKMLNYDGKLMNW